MERRLAAVLIADVAGYGRLSQADEEGTRAHFQADLHEVLEPKIAVHHDRLVKTMGDGLLVEFQSVVDAVRCATEVQRAKTERDAGLGADHRLRIGINLGDVIIEGDDIHGDGVNIADRLQGLAEPGGIAISGTAYDHVQTKLGVGVCRPGRATGQEHRQAGAGLSRAHGSRCGGHDDSHGAEGSFVVSGTTRTCCLLKSPRPCLYGATKPLISARQLGANKHACAR